METQSQTAQQPKWDNRLLQNLPYIRANLKYPFISKGIWPLAIWGVLLTVLCYFLYTTMSLEHRVWYTFGFWFIMLILPYMGQIARYAKSLRFTIVNTGCTVHENKQLIVAFLHSLEIAVYQHPDVPEVFQITSRTTGAGREIILFIADDNRVLINGHFTGWLLSRMTHKKEMLELSNAWLAKNAIISTDTSIIANSAF